MKFMEDVGLAQKQLVKIGRMIATHAGTKIGDNQIHLITMHYGPPYFLSWCSVPLLYRVTLTDSSIMLISTGINVDSTNTIRRKMHKLETLHVEFLIRWNLEFRKNFSTFVEVCTLLNAF